MKRYARTVRFDEVDIAGVVFFARYLNYGHEAMEDFFAGFEGGYAGLVKSRGVGFPAVNAEVTYTASLRLGDPFFIDTSVLHIGNTSCVFGYRIWRSGPDGTELDCARIRHTCVVCNLPAMTKLAIPSDIRAHLSAHLQAEAT
jgi:YbgC/YbaW family acyl-CoA thioester hydrolase